MVMLPLTLLKKYVIPGQADFSNDNQSRLGKVRFHAHGCQMITILRRAPRS